MQFVVADLVVKAIRAVEDHTLDGQGLCQVLGGLCFTCPCWSSWSTSQVQLESPHQTKIATVLMSRIRDSQ